VRAPSQFVTRTLRTTFRSFWTLQRNSDNDNENLLNMGSETKNISVSKLQRQFDETYNMTESSISLVLMF